jgi:2-dehydro-3-deoxygluconokinase
MYDLMSLGEVMLRLTPPKFERLRQMRQLDVCVAGSQLNVAANLAQLGKKTAFVSKLPDNELGLLARDVCSGYGVDMSYTRLVPNSRMGVNYVEFSATPRAGVAVYDRQNSAASTISPEDFDWEALARQTRIAYTDGILPGLSASCRAATLLYLQHANALGCVTAFDVNYREHLWTEETARTCWEELLPLVDIVVTNRSVSEAVFDFKGSDEEILRRYQENFGCKLVCLTHREMLGVLRGAWNCKALFESQIIEGRRYEFDVIDRFGTGDAFFAGLLYGYLEGDITFALNFGNAACALAHTIEGDVARLSAADVLPLLNETIDLRVKR